MSSISSEPAIALRNVRKVYRLYDSPRQRLLDALGLLPRRTRPHAEHVALDDVTVTIGRGEKVAIIGRNGAGKSTLLKILSGVTEPSSGTATVTGRIHPLLQLGTGFHPELTGRENALAYFAQLGVRDREQARLLEDVIDFAELEEYIDQPVKTYSSGMGVRLMFATATAIVPDLLLLDEILGVGDAYFTQKSFGRVDALCRASRTTLLLVTHDLYSAARLCDRVLWIDRGRVVMDDVPAVIIRAYEDSIRLQEEQRLRGRAQRLSRAGSRTGTSSAVSVEFRNATIGVLPAPVYFGAIELVRAGATIARLPIGDVPADGSSRLEADDSAWGDAVSWHGTASRPFLNYGSPFRKVAATFDVPRAVWTGDARDLQLRVRCHAERACALVCSAFIDGAEYAVGQIAVPADRWTEETLTFGSRTAAADGASGGVHGTGAVAVQSVRLQTDAGTDVHIVRHGDPMTVVFDYRINDPALREQAQLLLAIMREGVEDVCRVQTDTLLFDASQACGTVRLRLPRCPLANGRYELTVMVARRGYYGRPVTRYFSINPDVYACVTRALEFVVEGAGAIGTGTAVVLDGEWMSATSSRPDGAVTGR